MIDDGPLISADTVPPFDGRHFVVERVREPEAPKYEMDTGAADRLGVFACYRFFSPGILYALRGLHDEEPFCQFLSEYPGECHLLHRHFSQAIFRGMVTPDGDRGWDHALWAVEADAYPALENFLLSLTFHDPASKRLWRIGATDITIVDPLYVERVRLLPSHVPVLRAVAFGIDGSRGRIAVDASTEAGRAFVTGGRQVLHYPPSDQVTSFARTLFGAGPEAAQLAIAEGLPVPITTPPLQLRVGEFNMLPAAAQADVLQAVAAYQREFQG